MGVLEKLAALPHEWLLVLMVGGPLLFGMLAYLSPAANLRKALVIAASVFTALIGLAVSTLSTFHVTFGHAGGLAAQAVELLLTVVIIAIALRERAWLLLPLAAVQLGCLFIEGISETAFPITWLAAGADFVFDPLAMILVLVVSLVGSVIVVYAVGYMSHHELHAPPTAAGNGRFFLFLVAFLGAMNGLVLANSLAWLLVFWEFTTLCSYMLIGHDGTPEARRNAVRALLINTFGGAAMSVAGVVAQHAGVPTSLSGIMTAKAVFPMALLCLAAFTKSAQVPFQSWLLGAMVAPTPVSALLHAATMVKAGSYLVLRLAPAFGGEKVLTVITLVGAFTFAVTAMLAIGQSNGKKVLAYSTISNLGLIVACAGLNTPLAYGAAMMILCFHAVSKALLFLCVGAVEQRIGSRDIEDMGGLMFRMPVTATFALLGMVSMLVPPFGMLLSKWMAIEAAVRAPLPLMLIIAGSAFTMLFWAKWIGRMQTVSYHRKYTAETMSPSMLSSLSVLAIGVVVAGCTAIPLYQYILEPACRAMFAGRLVAPGAWVLMDSANRLLLWPAFILLGGALVLALVRTAMVRESHVRMPFMCGENLESDVAVDESGFPSYTFVGPADKPVTAWVGAFYLRNVFNEARLTPWVNFLGGMLLLGLLGHAGAH